MNILHVTFNMDVGGTEQVISQLVEAGDSHQFNQEIACIDGSVGAMGQRLIENGTPVTALQRKPGIDLSLAWALRRLIRSQNIRIVHCHQYTPYFYGWLAARLTGALVVFTEHGRFHPDHHRRKAKWLNRYMAWSTAALVAISNATADALQEYEFMPRRKIRVLYNGLRGKAVSQEESATVADELAIPLDARVICMVSRLDPIKNHRMALQAFAELSRRVENLVLVIVGDGPERANIAELVRELGLSDRVRLVGYSDRPERYMAIADIYLLTSRSEGTSMTLLEAMSLGVVPIATDVGGNPEIIDQGKTGYLVPDDDYGALADTLAQLLDQPDRIVSLGRAARDLFEDRFSVDRMVGNYARLYNEVAGTQV